MNELLPMGHTYEEKACCSSRPTPITTLRSQKRNLEARLAEVNKALDALEKNPEVAELLEVVSRGLSA